MNPAAQINQFLQAKGSPLAGLGNAFVQAGARYGIDPLLLVAITGAESSYATAHLSGSHNPFGWGPGHNFQSFAEAINTVAAGLRNNYLDQGLKTIAQIGNKWAPVGASNDPSGLNNNWVSNVSAAYGELGGKGLNGGRPYTRQTGSDPASGPDLAGVGFQGLTDIARGSYTPSKGLQALTAAVAGTQTTAAQPVETSGKVTLAAGADRAGVHTQQIVLDFVGRIAGIYGQALTIGTGTNHSQYTVNGNVSEHWSGHAADIPATGAQLVRLGRAALIAAGADPGWAQKQTGGLFNMQWNGHRVQVIFNTHIGGDHTNHLHVGIH